MFSNENMEMHVHYGNRLEVLAEAVAELVRRPLSNPLAKEIIIVQSRGMEHWLSMQLAKINGICANIEFPFPARFLQHLFNIISADSKQSLLEKDELVFAVLNELEGITGRDSFLEVEGYLEDGDERKRYRFARKVADLFDQYQIFRPEMVLDWEEKGIGGWQPELWRSVFCRDRITHKARLRRLFFEKITSREIDPGDLPQRLSVFGISYLPLFFLEIFQALSSVIEVHLFLLNPCMEYWADIISEREDLLFQKRYGHTHIGESGNRILALMGQMGRRFLSLTCGMASYIHEHFQDVEASGILKSIQHQILHMEESVIEYDADDMTLMIHSCHSRLREVEVLFDSILNAMERRLVDEPRDILVMAPDIEEYIPYIEAVFGHASEHEDGTIPQLPYSISDHKAFSKSRIVRIFFDLLEVGDSRFGFDRVMALLEEEEIRERFGISEKETEELNRWFSDTRIRWGLDSEMKEVMGLPATGENTWAAGLERIMMGAAIPETESDFFCGILPYDDMEASDLHLVTRFLGFLDRLVKWHLITKKKLSLSEWADEMEMLVDLFFPDQRDVDYEKDLILSGIGRLRIIEKTAGLATPVGFDLIKEYLKDFLSETTFSTGFITKGITFCSMLPARSIPFEMICLLGINSDSFPRNTPHPGFDLMSLDPKPLDRDRRKDDRYLFLETLISAKKMIHLSYVGQDIHDNSTIPPSILITELLDYISRFAGVDPESIIIRHPLHPFSPVYFEGKSNRFRSFLLENYDAAITCTGSEKGQKAQGSQIGGKRIPEEVSIDKFSKFFTHPARFFLKEELGVFLEDEIRIRKEKEDFSISPLEAFMMADQLFNGLMEGKSVEEQYLRMKAEGRLPPGSHGRVEYEKIASSVQEMWKKIGPLIPPVEPGLLNIDEKIKGIRLTGNIKRVYPGLFFDVRFAGTKGRDILRTWILHLLVCCSGKESVCSWLLTKDGFWRIDPLSRNKCLDILNDLVAIFKDGVSGPVRFFPETSYAYAKSLIMKKKAVIEAARAAEMAWKAKDFGPARGESEDPYNALLFREMSSPVCADFEKISKRIFTPVFEHLVKEE